MNEIKIKPLADRVIIEPIEADNKTTGGIIIPDSSTEKPQKGVVVAVGPGKEDEEMTLNVGDVVLFGKYGGTEINYEDKTYLVMRESDVYAVIEQ